MREKEQIDVTKVIGSWLVWALFLLHPGIRVAATSC